MKKEDTQKFEEMSLKVFGSKYEYRKLMTKGLVYERQLVNPNGKNRPAYTARRRKLTPDGVMAYMEKTLEMRQQVLKDMEKKEKDGNE